MKYILQWLFLFLTAFANAQTRFDVSSEAEFNTVYEQASAGDSIVWQPGTYSNIRMELDKDGLIVTANPYGTVLFTGASRVVIQGDGITLSGFQYIGGNIGSLNVINNYGSDVLITHVNIQNYMSYKYLVVDEESRRTTISYCNFENRINLDDQNILSILVDDEPGYHKIQYCSFKNFKGSGQDMGIEPIRIGVSSQGHLDSRTLVEFCYFTQCDGDGEIISHKSRQNVYRYNTFINNSKAELVLRHGDEGIVYGNFFINNMGGIRVREGSEHFIFNNYFEGLARRAIFLQNDPSDPLSNIHIYHNTVVNSAEVILGGAGGNPPTTVTIANNIFNSTGGNLFNQATGNETWIGNLSFGILGIDRPSAGLSEVDPLLSENAAGFYQPVEESPLIASASDGYPEVPLFDGMDYDHELLLDLMKQSRPQAISDKAIGASEYSSTVQVQPHATETNTGPIYLFDNLVDYLTGHVNRLFYGNDGGSKSVVISSNLNWTVSSNADWINTNLKSGSGDAVLDITLASNEESVERKGTVLISGDSKSVTIEVNQDPGEQQDTDEQVVLEIPEYEMVMFPNPTNGSVVLKNLPMETNSLQIELFQLDGRLVNSKSYQTDSTELTVNLDSLATGVYLMKIKFLGEGGMINHEWVRKFVRE